MKKYVAAKKFQRKDRFFIRCSNQSDYTWYNLQTGEGRKYSGATSSGPTVIASP